MEKQENREDRLLFIVIGIILLVAIAVVIVWLVTKDDKLDDKDNDKKETPIVNPDKDDDDKKEEKEDNPIVVIPSKPIEDDVIVEEEVEETIEWSLISNLTVKSLVGKPINVVTDILVNGELKTSYVSIMREVSLGVWEEVAFTNNVFIPTVSGNYRFIFKYNNEEKIHSFIIANEDVVKISDTLVNCDEYGNTFELNERFRVIMANQKMVSITSNNDIHNIVVTGNLKAHEDTGRDLKKPIGLLVDLSGRVSNIVSISSTTQGVYVDLTGTEPWGGDLVNGIVLVWLDANDFEHNKLTGINLMINGDTYTIVVKINNWQIPSTVQNEVIENEMITLSPEVLVNAIDNVAVLTVEKLNAITGLYEEVPLTNYEFTPVLGEVYRYVYTYEGEEKILDVNVLEKFAVGSGSDKVDDTLLTDNQHNGGEFETQERFEKIKENLGKITVTLNGSHFDISVNGNLVAHVDATRDLRIPIGLILDLTGEITTVTDISTNTNGVYVDMDGTIPWGANTPEGEILVWLDFNEFEFDTTYNISLKLVGEFQTSNIEIEKLFTIKLIDNRPPVTP